MHQNLEAKHLPPIELLTFEENRNWPRFIENLVYFKTTFHNTIRMEKQLSMLRGPMAASPPKQWGELNGTSRIFCGHVVIFEMVGGISLYGWQHGLIIRWRGHCIKKKTATLNFMIFKNTKQLSGKSPVSYFSEA